MEPEPEPAEERLCAVRCSGSRSAREDELLEALRTRGVAVPAAVPAGELGLDFSAAAAAAAGAERASHLLLLPAAEPAAVAAACVVAEWLLSRPPPAQGADAGRALLVPSRAALQLARSRLACHAALRKAGLPVPRTVAVLSEAGADRAAESFAGGAFRAAEDRAGQWLAPGGGGGALLRGPSDLAAALAAAAAQYPIVLQAWPECGRAHLLFANHKLDSATVVSAAPADAELFDRRGLPREFLDELSAWLRRNDVALARVEVGFDAEMAGCQM